MTIELLKSESVNLTKLEKLEFLQYLVELVFQEERASGLTEEQEKILLRRKNEILTGKVKTIPAEVVKNRLIEKYGLHA